VKISGFIHRIIYLIFNEGNPFQIEVCGIPHRGELLSDDKISIAPLFSIEFSFVIAVRKAWVSLRGISAHSEMPSKSPSFLSCQGWCI
jgi:hypothetical protein